MVYTEEDGEEGGRGQGWGGGRERAEAGKNIASSPSFFVSFFI